MIAKGSDVNAFFARDTGRVVQRLHLAIADILCQVLHDVVELLRPDPCRPATPPGS